MAEYSLGGKMGSGTNEVERRHMTYAYAFVIL
jgi:hypothetical protein